MWRKVVLAALILLVAQGQETTFMPDESENESAEAELGTLSMGIYVAPGDNFLTYRPGDTSEGTYEGFEVELLKELIFNELGKHNAVVEMVRLADLDSRISALNDGTVDFVLGSFFVTPEREELVDMIKPYYYSAGTALFAPNGTIPNVQTWQDLNGKAVAIPVGFYASQELLEYGAALLPVKTAKEAADAIANGDAVALADLTTNSHQDHGLYMVTTMSPSYVILEMPIGMAVAKGNGTSYLAEELTEAMIMMTKGGENATILEIEERVLNATGNYLPPNPYLREMVNNPDKPTFLWPAASNANDTPIIVERDPLAAPTIAVLSASRDISEPGGPAVTVNPTPIPPPSLPSSPSTPPPSGMGSLPDCTLTISNVANTYAHCYDASTPSTPAEVFFTVEGGVLKAGARATTDGWIALAFGDQGMIGSNAVFAVPCSSCPTGAATHTQLLAGYSPSLFQDATVQFSDIQAEKTASGEMELSFSTPWPLDGAGNGVPSLNFRFVNGRAGGDSGEITDMYPHSSPPKLRILYPDGTAECLEC